MGRLGCLGAWNACWIKPPCVMLARVRKTSCWMIWSRSYMRPNGSLTLDTPRYDIPAYPLMSHVLILPSFITPWIQIQTYIFANPFNIRIRRICTNAAAANSFYRLFISFAYFPPLSYNLFLLFIYYQYHPSIHPSLFCILPWGESSFSVCVISRRHHPRPSQFFLTYFSNLLHSSCLSFPLPRGGSCFTKTKY